jgi:hypothetical protein
MTFLEALRKRRATRDYARKLPSLLARDYGASRAYTPSQVSRTIERYGLNSDYSCYAISMFSGRMDFDQYHHGLGENCDYDLMRAEVAAAHFNGDVHFTIPDILAAFPDNGDASGVGDGLGAADGHTHGHGDNGHGH